MSNTTNRIGCLGVFLVVLLCLSLLVNAGFLLSGFFDVGAFGAEDGMREVATTKPAKGVSTKIAILSLSGLITSHLPSLGGGSMVEDFQAQLKKAVEDKDVKAIVIRIDSPGGEVTASDELYTAVKKAKEAKPIVISMGGLAASGGYYVAIAGNYLFAEETTFTGSIGVIMQTYNYEGLMDKVGVHAVTYKSGAFKDMLSGARTATPEEVAYINKMVMDMYGRFVGLVAKERNLSEDMLRKGPADGRVISGKDALDLKLVDEIGDLEAAVKKAMDLGKAPGSAVVQYESRSGLGRYLKLLGKNDAHPKIEVNIGPAQEFQLQPGTLYLLPGYLAH